MSDVILEIRDLNIVLRENGEEYPAVDHVYMKVHQGETIGIIGESGSGKSVSCQAVMGLLDPRKWVCSGHAFLDGKEIPLTEPEKLRPFCGKKIAMILQNPMSAFDMSATIRSHFLETVLAHGKEDRQVILRKACETMERLHLRDPEKVLNSYPFQCSGGMLQRIMIAMNLMLEPEIMIADEPTTALDRTIQQEIITLLGELKKNTGMSMILVSHDLSIMTHLADSLYVMYSGQLIEQGKAEEVIGHPRHPYTKGLLESRPQFSKKRLHVMEGNPPVLTERQAGFCQFRDRCGCRKAECDSFTQKIFTGDEPHFVSCTLADV